MKIELDEFDPEIQLFLANVLFFSSITPIEIKNQLLEKIKEIRKKINETRANEIISLTTKTNSYENLAILLLTYSKNYDNLIPLRAPKMIDENTFETILTKTIKYFESTEFKKNITNLTYNWQDTIVIISVVVVNIISFLLTSLSTPLSDRIISNIMKLADTVVSNFVQYPLLHLFHFDRSLLTFENIETYKKASMIGSYTKINTYWYFDTPIKYPLRKYESIRSLKSVVAEEVFEKKRVTGKVLETILYDIIWFIAIMGIWAILFLLTTTKSYITNIYVSSLDQLIKNIFKKVRLSYEITGDNYYEQIIWNNAKNRYIETLQKMVSLSRVFGYIYPMIKKLLNAVTGKNLSLDEEIKFIINDVQQILLLGSVLYPEVSYEHTRQGNINRSVTVKNVKAPSYNLSTITAPKNYIREKYGWLREYTKHYESKREGYFIPLIYDILIPLITFKPIKPQNPKNNIYIYILDLENIQNLKFTTKYEYYQDNYNYNLFGSAIRIQHTDNRMELTISTKFIHPEVLQVSKENAQFYSYYNEYVNCFNFLLSSTQLYRYNNQKYIDVALEKKDNTDVRIIDTKAKIIMHNKIINPLAYSIFNAVYEIDMTYFDELFLHLHTGGYLKDATIEQEKMYVGTIIGMLMFRQNSEYYKSIDATQVKSGIKRRFVVKSLNIQAPIKPENIAIIDNKKILIEYDVNITFQEIFTSL